MHSSFVRFLPSRGPHPGWRRRAGKALLWKQLLAGRGRLRLTPCRTTPVLRHWLEVRPRQCSEEGMAKQCVKRGYRNRGRAVGEASAQIGVLGSHRRESVRDARRSRRRQGGRVCMHRRRTGPSGKGIPRISCTHWPGVGCIGLRACVRACDVRYVDLKVHRRHTRGRTGFLENLHAGMRHGNVGAACADIPVPAHAAQHGLVSCSAMARLQKT